MADTEKKMVFRDSEFADVHGNKYLVIAGRLRVAHEVAKDLTIETEELLHEMNIARFKATVMISGRKFNGHGEATKEGSEKVSGKYLEYAETKAIARALRFAGIGYEYVGAEEMRDVEVKEKPKKKTEEEKEANKKILAERERLQKKRESKKGAPKKVPNKKDDEEIELEL